MTYRRHTPSHPHRVPNSPQRSAQQRPARQAPGVRSRAQSRSGADTRRAAAGATRARGHASRTAGSSPVRGLLVVVVAALLLVGIVVCIGRCSAQPAPRTTATTAPAYVSPFDWSGLERSDGFLTYSENGVQKSQVGVDVSEHQGYIDWQAVADDGVQFAFARAGNRGYTAGTLSADSTFTTNVDGARSAGLDVGAYFFSQAISVQEAQEEADFVLDLLDGRSLDLPVVFDHEPVADAAGRANNLDRSTITACANAFCERIEAAGYRTMIYGNSGDMARYDRSNLGNRPIWFAEYGAFTPGAQFDIACWQYTNTGQVSGISTPVDLNLRFTDYL